MRRKFTRVPILGMAISRSDAIDKLKGISEPVEIHLLKCILYGDSLRSYEHWVNKELAEFFNAANILLVKGNKKLKRKDYEEYLFGRLGDAKADTLVSLTLFRAKYTGQHSIVHPSYPDFEIDEYMVADAFNMFQEVKSTLCDMLITKNTSTKSDIQVLLHRTMDKYCIKG